VSLSEFEIIAKYFEGLTAADADVAVGIGDDAAVITIPPGRQLVSSVDTLVSGVHFFTDADPYDVGYKSLAVNISDLAAMGAQPRWATLALTVPENDLAWLEKFAAGFAEPARKYGVSLVGGDLTHGPLSITVQILGLVAAGKAVTRGGAQTGDAIYVSGCIGGAGLALQHLAGKSAPSIQPAPASIARLLRPEPRAALGMKLVNLAHAAIDISDGLAADLGHILEESGKGAAVELERLPLCEDVRAIGDRDLRYRLALSAGDDYELCFTVPSVRRDEVAALSAGVNLPLTRIGRIIDGGAITWRAADGSDYRLRDTGYRHF
jgi:thiamine-monophosphate kinase